jgi:hypothetical protein
MATSYATTKIGDKLELVRASDFTGDVNSMVLNVTEKQIDDYFNDKGYIQTIFPDLSASEREFIKTGCTPDEWKKIFGEEG